MAGKCPGKIGYGTVRNQIRPEVICLLDPDHNSLIQATKSADLEEIFTDPNPQH